jgi:hypothetical protein
MAMLTEQEEISDSTQVNRILKQDRQWKYNVTLRRFRVTIVAMEKQ